MNRDQGNKRSTGSRPCRRVILVLGVAAATAGAARAQEGGLIVSAGARAWNAGWTTFSYVPDPNNANQSLALSQVAAHDKLLLMPVLALRYGSFSGSISGIPSTDFSFVGGGSNVRQELDLNLGYDLIPGLTPTLGYKRISQREPGGDAYRPAGLVLGLSANAVLSGPWSLYASLGVGRFRTPAGDRIQFDADYRLTELGLVHTLNGAGPVRRWTITAGYRTQVLSSRQAFVTPSGDPQSANDTTQGLSFGVLASF